METTPVVILCGGMGTRLREETEFKPKPLVEVGNRPILWHIMKIYAHFGFKLFILCLGYKGDLIKNYFLNYKYMNNDFSLNLNSNEKIILGNLNNQIDWNIILADTGLLTNTGGRIKKIQKYIHTDTFLATYGDGVADIDINALVKFHKEKGKIATLTGFHPLSRFGVLEVTDNDIVKNFKEKPRLDGLINGGFYVFDRKVFEYLDENSILEHESLERLAHDGELAVYHHLGFWKSMDTYRDYLEFNRMWEENNTPWKLR